MSTLKKEIVIRVAALDDAEELLKIYAPYVRETAITFEYEVPSPEEFRERIAHTLEKYPYLVAEHDGKIVGYAYVSPFKERAAYAWAVETSIYVRREGRRQGVGRALYAALEHALAAQGMLNLNACIAYPPVPDPHLNRDSVDFHQHLGYRMVGRFFSCGYKFHRWYDMVWMEKLIGPHEANQPPVRPFPEVSVTLGYGDVSTGSSSSVR